MGQQHDKTIKRRRRKAYLVRKKLRELEQQVAGRISIKKPVKPDEPAETPKKAPAKKAPAKKAPAKKTTTKAAAKAEPAAKKEKESSDGATANPSESTEKTA